MPPIAPPDEEIRIALALNGGVSLAVWMGGCAVELDCARRAHLGPEDLAYGDFAPPEGGTKARSAYAALCAAFGRQLVPDILSGASAGGINGALLGAAMRAGRRLHPEFVRREWIQLGDFSRLLHEATEEEPSSLMQGQMFHDDLLAAFEAVLGTDPDSPAARASALPKGHADLEARAPQLEVTMTDVAGVEKIFADEWGGQLVAREHRGRFRFREPQDYTAANLAAAARSSASFPVAFEPWHVTGSAAVLAQLKQPAYAVDGGLLDNAPIKAALDLIPRQRAEGRVRRYVCYLNADPPQPAVPGTGVAAPELKDVIGYMVNLPRLAPFVDQLYAVEESTRRAHLAPLIQKPLLSLDLATLRATATALLPAYRRRRGLLSLDELMAEPGATPSPAEAEPAEPRDKLTGVGLGHFAGFYRSSWRANDFMWGRLDAAARIVEVLVDKARPPAGAATVAAALAASAVPPNATEAARWLIHETLEEGWAAYALRGECVPGAEQLAEQLTAAFVAELDGPGDETPLIQAVFTRAAQLEILQDELPILVEESARDSRRGSSSPPLELPLESGMRATIETLRERAAQGETLPSQLDDTNEEVSDLGLRTITHAAFVALSAARTAGAPLSKFFGVVRAPLQAVSGSVSQSLLSRATVAFAFWAAALYLTMRLATTEAVARPALSDVWSQPVLVSLVAALAVAGVVLVPGLRAWRGIDPGRNWLWVAGLAGSGSVGAALLLRYEGPGDVDFTNVIFATGSLQLPEWLLTLVLAVAVGLAAVRLPLFGGAATTWLASLRDGWLLCGPLLAISAAAAGTSAWRLWPLLGQETWQTLAASLALFAVPVLIVFHLLVPLLQARWRELRRRIDRLEADQPPASNL
ncbi:MAG: DUF3376 domain-containing protein [Solirubrobacterales bacterium]